MRKALAEPVQNKLFIAGEATSSNDPSTADGPVFKEQERLVELIRDNHRC